MAFPSSLRGNRLAVAALGVLLLAGCRTLPPPSATAPVAGDEIVVAGRRFHTGTRVVTWRDPGGYNAYAGEPALKPRQAGLSPAEQERIRQHGWDLPALQKIVDQFVLHYDACGLSKVCFDVLHARGLNVHFLLDVDGTIYQTLDLQERALHATIANDRSIGIEIANLGAYPPGGAQPLATWYRRDARGGTVLQVPGKVAVSGIATRNFSARPARPAPVRGIVQGRELVQYDFTPEQYAALIKLTAALCRVFPRIQCDYPHTFTGRVISHRLTDRQLANWHGILGHYHIQEDKVDPGPAFQWRRLVDGARALLH